MWIDRLVTAGIIFLILFSPLAFGSVHPWAFASMEAVVFVLLLVWMGRVIAGSREQGAEIRGQRPVLSPSTLLRINSVEGSEVANLPFAKNLALPLALFFAFILFQLLPLPPALLRLVSPATFEVYSRSLSGWPGAVPYADLLKEQGAGSTEHGAGSRGKSAIRNSPRRRYLADPRRGALGRADPV